MKLNLFQNLILKKILLVALSCLTPSSAFAQVKEAKLAIIPEPVSIQMGSGHFKMPKQLTIGVTDALEPKRAAQYLQNKIVTATGASVSILSNSVSYPNVLISLLGTPDPALGKEGYRLIVKSDRIFLNSNTSAGLFYGVQTLLQLFPKEIESASASPRVEWEIPTVEILDFPRFAWRGLLLDVARHFFTKEEVKQYIDQMARYKFNVLHLHLTDDEGWRVEIKSLPRLTAVASHNVKKIGQFGSFSPPAPDAPRDYGGFYTQDDIRELVRYGQERFVNIMPEIDVPGHSLATVVAYPELSCSPDANRYQVISGEHMTEDNTLDPSNEKTYLFLDQVLTEISQLFPFEYIHMGGDEAVKTSWAKSASVNAFMKKENIADYSALQGYFEKRVEKIVESKGKKFMGWDEIIDGGLGPNAAVTSWRGDQGGVIASQAGHDVVMSPQDFTYFDYMQSDAVNETHVYATLRLSKSYQFDPTPPGVNDKLIRGGQANLWTEQIFNFRQVEYMTWPRAFAIAEAVWSPKSKRNWNEFYPKVEKHFARFDESEVNYARSMYSPTFDASYSADHNLIIVLTSEVPDVELHYSFDNSFPDCFYPKYNPKVDGPMIPPEDATQLRVITCRGKEKLERIATMPIALLKRRLDKKIKEAQAPAEN